MTETPSPDFAAAQWIHAPWHGGARSSVPVPCLRRSFPLEQLPVKATLHFTALGLADVAINAQPVSDDVLFPGWTDYRKRVRSLSLDVLSLLQTDENVLAVQLGDGWYCGHVANRDRMTYGQQPELKMRLEMHFADGSHQDIVSDESWRCQQGAILAADLLMGESTDLRFQLQGWNLPGYNAAHWQPVQVGGKKDCEIQPWFGPRIKRHESLPATAIDPQPGTRHFKYDLGQNITGRIRIRAKAMPGATLRLRYAEMLTPEGQLYLENLRSARAEDFLTFADDCVVEWEPRFTFHGFRYIEAEWTHPGQPGEILEMTGVVIHSDMPRSGHFSCAHPLLNQLYQNTLWGQKGNFLDVPTDCPQRDERLGWTGDAQVFVGTASLIMDVKDFFRKWLLDLRDSQAESGVLPPVAPGVDVFGLESDGNSGWADAAFIVPMELYRSYGDPQVIREQLESCTRYMEYLAENKVKDFIRGHQDVDAWGGFGDWLAKDGGEGNYIGRTPKDLIGTAFYYHNAKLLAAFHEILGDAEAAKPWQQLASEVRKAFQQHFLTSEGVPVVDTQTASVLALHFNLLDPAQEKATGAFLAKLVRENGCQLNTGFLGTVHLLPALEKADEIELAYQVLESEDYPSWLFPIKNGATTIWERWDGWTPENGFQDPAMNSFNHYAYGAVCAWMVETVAGLRPAEPGYKSICFHPRPGGTLQHAEASLETPHGLAAIRWEREGEQLKLTLTVPEDVTATLDLGEQWTVEDLPELSGGKYHLTALPRTV